MDQVYIIFTNKQTVFWSYPLLILLSSTFILLILLNQIISYKSIFQIFKIEKFHEINIYLTESTQVFLATLNDSPSRMLYGANCCGRVPRAIALARKL